jgi:hypothetical protein
LLRCLAKDPAERPQSARLLAGELAACTVTTTWHEGDAERWWRSFRPDAPGTASPGTDDGRFQATLLGAAARDNSSSADTP